MSPLSSFVSNAASLVSANPNVAYPNATTVLTAYEHMGVVVSQLFFL